MRSLIDEQERSMMLDLTGQDRPVPPLGASPAAKSDLRATCVHAGPAEGAGRPNLATPTLSSWPTPDEILQMAITQVGCSYALARMAMAEAGPLPLVSSEPWVESDEAYRKRLNDWNGSRISTPDRFLDDAGVVLGLPRARLVQTQGGE